MNPQLKPYLFALVAFLAAWQGSEFALDYRAVLGAIVAAALGGVNPNSARGRE